MDNKTQKVNKISTQPYKGARDFYPKDMQVRNYIFSTWKRVCRRFGFEEYDFPILEPLGIFAAKTGEEIVNQQLYSFEDRGGRKLAIRPELTPGTVRMIARKYKELPQPIKWFMIGNNWRFEKPQLGRGREFYQLEVNIFGENGVSADFEIFLVIIEIMKGLGATNEQFTILLSDRRLIIALLKETLGLDEKTQTNVRRVMDKRKKMEKVEFLAELQSLSLSAEQANKVEDFMTSGFDSLAKIIPQKTLENNEGYKNVKNLFEMLKKQRLNQYCKFDPSIIRGFDYSDGLVYEVFDKNPKNSRSIFGGERFDKLIQIFGNYDLPATGFAMGDYTLGEFLKNWGLLPEFKNLTEYLVTVWPSENTKFLEISQEVAAKMRALGKNCTVWLDANSKIEKQLRYADKKGIPYSVLLGEKEIETRSVTIKNMKTQIQETKSLDAFYSLLS